MRCKLSQEQINDYKLQLKNEFLEKIFGFAFNKTHDRDKAEELAQEEKLNKLEELCLFQV